MNSLAHHPSSEALSQNDSRWQSIIGRDTAADGKFYYAVKSTGVYCRPSCAARRARRENVQFHATREDAERAGFRPCKRCKPNEPSRREQQVKTVSKICRLIENAEIVPSLAEMARHAGLSRYHFQRLFKSITGLTPKAYAGARRAASVRTALRQASSITEALYSAGYNSSGRFYAESDRVLGMTPTTFRAGGADTTIRFAIRECSLGSVLVAASERGVCAIALGDDAGELARDLHKRFPNAQLSGADDDFEKLISRVVELIDEPARGSDLPLDIRGTAFQQRVWQALREIAPGSTATYSGIAGKIGLPKAVRAVARACAANKLAVAIPCHRVVRTDGNLSGYRWGVERKRALLNRELGNSPAKPLGREGDSPEPVVRNESGASKDFSRRSK